MSDIFLSTLKINNPQKKRGFLFVCFCLFVWLVGCWLWLFVGCLLFVVDLFVTPRTIREKTPKSYLEMIGISAWTNLSTKNHHELGSELLLQFHPWARLLEYL